jgi:hypothetical protein
MANSLEADGEMELPMFESGLDGMIEPRQTMTQGVVNYYFPVEVIVVGGLTEAEHKSIEAQIWENFGDALERMT